MKLYTTGVGHWAGTQADAKKLKKEHGVPCDMHEVPVAKAELLAFLNTYKVALTEQPEEVVEETPPSSTVVEPSQVAVAIGAKVVGQTKEEYMQHWKQQQADWDAEYKCKEAIEEVLWTAPLDHVGSFMQIVLSRVDESLNELQENRND